MNKVVATPAGAVADIGDHSSIAIAGFGMGHRYPSSLITALRDKGSRQLCIACNYIGAEGDVRGNILAENGQIARLITCFTARPNVRSSLEMQIASGEIQVEMVPQGILVERLRAAGAGIPAFYVSTGIGTAIEDGKEVREFNGRSYLLESALPVDFAFLRADTADRAGNLRFRGTSQNFNPSFAKAARVAIAEVDHIVESGELRPEEVDLPGIFVSRVVKATITTAIEDIPKRKVRPGKSARTYLGRQALSRDAMARTGASLIASGTYVNLGMGLPSLMCDHLLGRDVFVHAENGILGCGHTVVGDEIDPDVYNAGGSFITVAPGGSFFDSLTSFEMARGGKLDTVVLGAYQVDAAANIANWATPTMVGGGIGGAMDLVAGQTDLMVVMDHCDGNGNPKLVHSCTYPLTGEGCVNVVVTDLGVFRWNGGTVVLEQFAPGFTPEEVVSLTELPVRISRDVVPMDS